MHAVLSPSSSYRWIRCPGSVALIERYQPKESTSDFADEGTYAHAVAAALLNGQPVPASKRYSAEEVAETVKPYVDYVNAIRTSGAAGCPSQIEQELDIRPVTGEIGAHGTADALVFLPSELVVVDLKYGMGVKVSAEYNSQLTTYAAAALEQYRAVFDRIETVRLVIVQPRLNSISEWRVPVGVLSEQAYDITQAAREATKQRGLPENRLSFFPSEKACKFCPMAGRCTAYARFSAAAAGVEVDAVGAVLSDEELASMFSKVDAVEQWCARIRATAMDQLMDGRPLPGFKLVAGREGIRKWRSDSAADELLRSFHVPDGCRYQSKLISPTQAGRLVKKKLLTNEQWQKLEGCIVRSEPKPAIAPESDPRPYWVAVSPEDFPVVNLDSPASGKEN